MQKMMTKQETFDRVWAHLTRAGATKSTLGGTLKCRYRTPDGNRCAIGCLIPDELYTPVIEGWDVAHLRRNASGKDIEGRVAAFLKRFDQELLVDLQLAHDAPTEITGVPSGYQKVAERMPWQESARQALQIIARRHGLFQPDPKAGEG